MIRHIPSSEVPLAHGEPMVFPEMALAHRWCRGEGIEIGAAAHNPFGLPGARNLAPVSDDPSHPDHADFLLYRQSQVSMCGAYAAVDLVGTANSIPLPDDSLDYVISSHALEHLTDVIGAWLEWNRVLKPGGIAFMIVPQRDALELDVGRPLTPLEHFVEDHEVGHDETTHPIPPGYDATNAHYHVFDPWTLVRLVDLANRQYRLGWSIVAVEETDSKVGNGHTLVAQYTGHPSLIPEWPLVETMAYSVGARLRALLRR